MAGRYASFSVFLMGDKSGERLGVGVTLMLVGTGSMLAAALVLFITSPDKRRAAVTQGLFPLLAVVSLVIALLNG